MDYLIVLVALAVKVFVVLSIYKVVTDRQKS
jgi:hypothetical protein